MTQTAVDSLFTHGIELFNQARFFEAHELWEQVWKAAEGEEKVLYQGLIQAAAALLHAQRGNYRGAVSTYVKAQPKLEKLPAAWKGIDVARLRLDLAKWFAASDTRERACEHPIIRQQAQKN